MTHDKKKKKESFELVTRAFLRSFPSNSCYVVGFWPKQRTRRDQINNRSSIAHNIPHNFVYT